MEANMEINLEIKRLTSAHSTVLEKFLFHALFVPPGAAPFTKDAIFQPAVHIYIKDFGLLSNDYGVYAQIDDQIVGAAWVRVIPGFGHVNNKTPELAISVLPDYRGQGIGEKLMLELFDILKKSGYKQTSLAVQKANKAVDFYTRLGYKILQEKDEEYVMIKGL